MKNLYYYYYLFYTKILPDDQPHSTVIFCLSIMESFIVNGLLNIISITIFCYNIPKWPMLVVTGAIMLLNFQIYYRSKKMEKIIAEKPKLFNSNAASVVFSVTFFLFSLSMIVTAPFYSKYLLERFCS
ncbi:hypothetical protein SAMN05421827_102327 [Pedobacter terrae]|uniref:Uncharacterized protein n=1 Tax=Pedobacter terrae TaxID=405671 RepID=A0A1G7QLI6_9SPHI|nr:hypothetical protein SAMN05421827_102327 [Pedobacter terrae]